MSKEYNPKTDLLIDEEEKKLQEEEKAAALLQQQDNNAVARNAALEAAADIIEKTQEENQNENPDNSLPEGVTSPHMQPTVSPDSGDAGSDKGIQDNGEENGNPGEGATAPSVDDEVTRTQQERDKANEDYSKALEEANTSRNKTFAEVVNDYYQRMKDEETQMQQEETADRFATVATGATELAAGIINMLGVGELHASNQQYHSYSQDWMKKAEDNIREHRSRRANMQDVLQRLKMQQEELRTSSRIEEAKLKAQQAQAAYNDALAAQKAADDAEDKEWKRGMEERKQAASEKGQDASIKQGEQRIAQGWAQINHTQEQFDAQQRDKGYIRDKNAPSGWRYDPVAAGVVSKKGDSTTPLVLMDKDGNISVANLTKEQKNEVFDSAYNAIESELGTKEAAEFRKKYNGALDDDVKGQVLREYMGRSEKVKEIISRLDNDYQARNGYAADYNKKPPTNEPVAPVYRKDYSTSDLISNL